MIPTATPSALESARGGRPQSVLLQMRRSSHPPRLPPPQFPTQPAALYSPRLPLAKDTALRPTPFDIPAPLILSPAQSPASPASSSASSPRRSPRIVGFTRNFEDEVGETPRVCSRRQ